MIASIAAGRRRGRLRALALSALCIGAGGCAETQLATHAVKKSTREAYGQPIRDVPVSQAAAIASEPLGGRPSLYKVGEPYQIDGAWYYPKEDLDYVETGIASWYGDEFHGRPTANGEVYDQYAISAAHRTLPLPSLARVTNLENGRSMNVRVNDRGPFARGRIIDMSRRGAEALGFHDQGTAKVKVEILAEESRMIKEAALRGQRVNPIQLASTAPASQSQVVAVNGLPMDPPIEPRVKVAPVGRSSIYVQAGAFAKYENAARVRDALTPVAPAGILQVATTTARLYRVRIGPLATVADADDALERVAKRGYPDARIVVE